MTTKPKPVPMGDMGTHHVRCDTMQQCVSCRQYLEKGFLAWRTRRKPVLTWERVGADGIVEKFRCTACYEKAQRPATTRRTKWIPTSLICQNCCGRWHSRRLRTGLGAKAKDGA